MKNLIKLSVIICLFSTIIFSQSAKKIDELMSQYAKFEQFNGTILVAERTKSFTKKPLEQRNLKINLLTKLIRDSELLQFQNHLRQR